MKLFPKSFDLSLYFIADPACCASRDVVAIARTAAEAGVTLIQYRDKISSKEHVWETARRMKTALAGTGVPLLINDYVDIAAEIGANGAHIGQGDTIPAEARGLLGPDAILGLTAFTEDHISAIDPAIVDYIGTGPVYPTLTDKGKPVLGPQRFAELVSLSPVPVVGIGGITADNAGAVREAGADGIAVMRAIGAADDVFACRALIF
ncbi:MAG: thiamine phosphate synthase [Alphaproteobacteria bacterium]|nr:thiamine phosphate synthase [Alphaproteobacteria bacterium]